MSINVPANDVDVKNMSQTLPGIQVDHRNTVTTITTHKFTIYLIDFNA